jgi:transposase-like protein
MKGKSTRIGAYKCYACRKPFTVKVGTIFEASHIKLHLWLQAIHLMCASKKGISSNQLHRTLGVTLKTAWFMSHRIREAMRPASLSPMGGTGSMVEVDETFIGRKKGAEVRHGYEHKMKVLSLVDRETGRAHSMVVNKLNTKTVSSIVRENVAREARLMTDEARHYVKVGREFADHQVVRHQDGEYGRGEAHTNTIEGFFSIFKRGMRGVYQHCSEEHLHRYLAEFDFRYNERIALGVDDQERADKALRGIVGKRLTYRAAGQEMST